MDLEFTHRWVIQPTSQRENDNTIQIQNDEHLRHYIAMRKKGGSVEELAELTAGGSSASRAMTSHRIP
jgi:hypothetical protein